jgi:hypothetical protein
LKTDATVTHANTVFAGQTVLALWNMSDQAPLAYYNALSVTQCWRQDMRVDDLKDAVVWADYVALSPNGALKQTAWLAMTQGDILNLANQGNRDAIVAIFGSGSPTVTALLGVVKRTITNFEALVASAPVQGAVVLPRTLYGIMLTADDIAAARIA